MFYPDGSVERTTVVLTAGTIVKINGVPLRLESDVTATTHPENIVFITEEQKIILPAKRGRPRIRKDE